MTDGFSWASAVALVALLLLIAPAAIRMQRDRNWLLSIAVWLGIAVVRALAYSLHGPPRRRSRYASIGASTNWMLRQPLLHRHNVLTLPAIQAGTAADRKREGMGKTGA